MRVTVLGGCGAWPSAGAACSGYLLEHDGFRLLVDPGYATLPELQRHVTASDVDAVVVTHGHPDHCADLNPLLRARALVEDPPPALPVHALPGALDAVLALDQPRLLDGSYVVRELVVGRAVDVGPFRVDPLLLPHFVPNAGLRLSAGGRVLAYTGDTGPSPDVVRLARGADLFLAEATYVDAVPERSAHFLTSARQAGAAAVEAEVGRLWLTHLWPGTDHAAARQAAAAAFTGEIDVATAGLATSIG